MKNIIILLTFLWVITSYAVAPYGIKGQQQAATLYSNVHQFPNNQVTNLGGINALVETGNTNILANPSFEHSTFSTSWTNSAGTFTQETSVLISGKASAKLVLAAQTMALTQSSTLYAAQFADGVQGLAMVRIKSDIALSVCSIQAGTVSTTDCVTTATDSKWGLYKIPFVMGATSQGISIASAGSVSGTVYVDDAFVGAVDIKTDVDQSRIAGESYFAGNASCSVTNATTTLAFGTNANCVAPTIVRSSMGDWLTTDSNGTRQIINNLPAGTYKATFNNIRVNQTIGGQGMLAINDGTTTCNPVNTGNDTVNQNVVDVSCTFNYTSSGDRTFSLYSASTTNTINLNNTVTTNTTGFGFQLEYFGSGQVYSSQCGANCVDTFSAIVSGGGTVFSQTSDFISGACSVTAAPNKINCTFKSGLFTVEPSCVAQNNTSSTGSDIIATTTTASGFSVNYVSSTVRSFNVICQKQGADFVATRTIQGTFNEVNVSPGISRPKTCIIQNAGATVTTACSGSPCTEYFDSCGTASACTRSGTGVYSCTWPAGTFANSTYVTCGASGTGAIASVLNTAMITGVDGSITNSIRTFNSTPAPADNGFSTFCTGAAP